MGKKYIVSYDDAPFPTIVESLDGDWKKGLSFADAKRELVAYCRERRNHWAEQLRLVKSFKKAEMRQ